MRKGVKQRFRRSFRRHDWGNQRSCKSCYVGFVCSGADGDAMMVPALIMAGGKGSRMGLPTEKPMLPFLGKPLIDWVAEADFERQKSFRILCYHKC